MAEKLPCHLQRLPLRSVICLSVCMKMPPVWHGGGFKKLPKLSFQRNSFQNGTQTNYCIIEQQTTVLNKLITVPILFLQSGHWPSCFCKVKHTHCRETDAVVPIILTTLLVMSSVWRVFRQVRFSDKKVNPFRFVFFYQMETCNTYTIICGLQPECYRWFSFLSDFCGFWEHSCNCAEKGQYSFHGRQ